MVSNGVSVVTTTWNERENIEKLVPPIRNVLLQILHEIIIVDDNSPDGTIQVANRLADVAVTKTREGQSKGLLYGMKLAKYPVIITIDADSENDPADIPALSQQTAKYEHSCGFPHQAAQNLRENRLQNTRQTRGRD